ncbi:MAG: nucleoside deaminase [Leptospiraceae bacterium]|nr:nucleoside deaminase [Leptospiraceae bacterium]MDW7975216.1 nucleoside deaminase [Leptospiraceae bacterium]
MNFSHEYYLNVALKQAKLAEKKWEVPVGAVLVKEGKIISKGHNLRVTKNNGIYHAEVVAIIKACKKLKTWRLDGCILYTTLEPCLMCSGAIIQTRISKVVFGAIDEKGGAIVSKYQVFDDRKLNHHPEYEYIKCEECSQILKRFFQNKRRQISVDA